MTETPKDTYEALLTTLLEENNKGYNERNHEYYSDTLNLFNKAGETDSVHHLWRHKYMIQEMISILTSHERTQNWWKYEEFDSYPDPELDLEQYINSEVYPSIARKELELMAAQEYIKQSKNLLIQLPNTANNSVVTPEESKASSDKLKTKLKTEGEEINLSQLVKKVDHLKIPRNTLRKKCERIAKDLRAGLKILPCPVYPDDEKFKYAVIKISDTLANKTKGMLFQKIVDFKEN
jgi:uncharacterized metal-binding protein YceD (DUF177 family)